MNIYHKSLTEEKWRKLPFAVQMANVGSEIGRTINWRKKGNEAYAMQAFERGLELLDLTIKAQVDRLGLRELTRLREFLVDYFVGENIYKSSSQYFEKYFYYFNFAANRNK